MAASGEFATRHAATRGNSMFGLFARKASLRLAVVSVLALTAAACANKESSPEAALNGAGGKFAPATPGTQRDFTQNVGDLVYFSSDSVDLTPEAGQTLAKQAQWLQQYPQYTITIEGHADERGTREYNIALGAKRATAVRTYLSQNGINAQRIRTISYGKERPVAVCNDISCWSQNRRAQTVLNSGGQVSQR
jgi:peptidoglycan-associated lipoprotein